MTKIGLLSDTHCTFDTPIMEFFTECDQLWHAGDFGNIETADAIARFRPLTGVHGNCDDHKLRLIYPKFQYFTCEGTSVLMTHIGGYPGRYEREVLTRINSQHPTIFISGHSHILKVMYDKQHQLLHLNPGAAGHGYQRIRTALRFTIDGTEIKDMEVGEWK